MAKPASEISKRVPPGQTVTEKWPVDTYGETPSFDPATWDFRVYGEVENPLRLAWEEFLQLPRVEGAGNFHCVDGWSCINQRLEGVAIKEILKRAKPKSSARFVMLHCDDGYEANLSLEDFSHESVFFAMKHDGKDLTPEHGYPLRLVAPNRYGWKSAKWVRAVEVMENDRRGFWEINGYHNHADIWKEERFAWQEEEKEKP